MYIKPTGLTVRDPLTKEALAVEGEAKPRDSYWLRRLDDGDVIECEAPKKKPAGKEQ